MNARPSHAPCNRSMLAIYLASAALLLIWPTRTGSGQTLFFMTQMIIVLLLDALYGEYRRIIDPKHPPLAVRSLVVFHAVRHCSPLWTSHSGYNMFFVVEYFFLLFSILVAAVDQLVFAGYVEMDGYKIKI